LDSNNYNTFIIEGKVNLSGDVKSLINYDENTVSDYCFYKLFSGCNAIYNIDELMLTSTKMGEYCYAYMFENCSNLNGVPKIWMSILADSCCEGMFKNCLSLTKSPELHIYDLENYCYKEMFDGCKLLNEINV